MRLRSLTPAGSRSAALLPSQLTSAELRRLRDAARLARGYVAKIAGDPMFQHALGHDGTQGSNEWAVAGSHTVNGHPLLANDPHLALGWPSTFYPIGLKAPGMDVEGEGFAGVPGVIIGHNRWISWGATVNPMDVTDTYHGEGGCRPVLSQRPVHCLRRHAESTSYRFRRPSAITSTASSSPLPRQMGCHQRR